MGKRLSRFASVFCKQIGKNWLRIYGLIVLLLVFRSRVQAQSTKLVDKQTPVPCTSTYLDFDSTTNVHALEEYQHAIAGLLKQGKFEELDCLADTARASKARFSGGTWKLHKIYSGLDEPQPGHATEQDWRAHLSRLNAWVAFHPHSVTARIALAKSYVGYGWDARGDGFSDTVSQSGWTLFEQRLEKAKAILEQAATLRVKCPEWYVVMQQVALGQGWDLSRETALYQQAIAFEPAYDLFYRMHAHYLLPKWHGDEGDSSRFAAEVADRVGGSAGDILYFQVGSEIICPCVDAEFDHMSWPRLQKAFEELRAQYGDSLINWNVLALMAHRASDAVAAQAAFQHIGADWDKNTWRTQEWFNQNKTWAAQFAPMQAQNRAQEQEAQANLQTPAGSAYMKAFASNILPREQACAQKAGADQTKFKFMVKVGKDGGAENGWFSTPTPVALCLMQDLAGTYARNEKIFPAPPHDSYWVMIEIDPALLNAAAK